MADTGEKPVRDRLAEALWRWRGWMPTGRLGHETMNPVEQTFWAERADRLLSALPTVGLRIGRVEE